MLLTTLEAPIFSAPSSKAEVDYVRNTALTDHEVHVWALQLHMMLSSGVPIYQALRSIAEADIPRVNTVCELLARRVWQGNLLSEAMRSLGPTFSRFVINMAVVGENTGQLARVLRRVSQRSSRREKTGRELKGALAYPVVLAAMSVGMALFMAFYMFPKLLPFLTGLGVGLPWPTRALVWLTNHLSFLVLGFTVVVLFVGRLLTCDSDPRIERVRQWLIYESPVLGRAVRERGYADCLNDLHLMLDANCRLDVSLKYAYAGSPEMERRIGRCLHELRCGSSFSEAVESSRLLPPSLYLQVKSGEETGQLVKVFKRLSEQLDESVNHRVSQLVQLLEPAILLVMGVITGFVVLATFLPLYNMAAVSF